MIRATMVVPSKNKTDVTEPYFTDLSTSYLSADTTRDDPSLKITMKSFIVNIKIIRQSKPI